MCHSWSKQVIYGVYKVADSNDFIKNLLLVQPNSEMALYGKGPFSQIKTDPLGNL